MKLILSGKKYLVTPWKDYESAACAAGTGCGLTGVWGPECIQASETTRNTIEGEVSGSAKVGWEAFGGQIGFTGSQEFWTEQSRSQTVAYYSDPKCLPCCSQQTLGPGGDGSPSAGGGASSSDGYCERGPVSVGYLRGFKQLMFRKYRYDSVDRAYKSCVPCQADFSVLLTARQNVYLGGEPLVYEPPLWSAAEFCNGTRKKYTAAPSYNDNGATVVCRGNGSAGCP